MYTLEKGPMMNCAWIHTGFTYLSFFDAGPEGALNSLIVGSVAIAVCHMETNEKLPYENMHPSRIPAGFWKLQYYKT